jgi:beta-glucosidase
MMGQAGGGAIADVLYGKVNPSGKLAETFPLRLVDTPAHLNFPGGNGEVRYGEGLFIGYRYYDARDVPVQFHFGYGMSYTTFAYRNFKASAKTFKDVDGLTVSVDVTNTGKVTGKEIVQVYVHDQRSGLLRPEKELKGFIKVELKPGETKTVSIPLDFRAFAYYHPAYRQWITEDGDFDILIGASSADIRGTLAVSLQSTLELPCILNRESTLRAWMEDPRGKRAFEPLFKQVIAPMQATFGGGQGEGGLDMDPSGFLTDMALRDILEFVSNALPKSPDELVDEMLKQAYSPDK